MARSTRSLIAHLLRRAGFGYSASDLETYSALGFEGAVSRLVNYEGADDGEVERIVGQMRAAHTAPMSPEHPEWGNRDLEVSIWLARMLLTKHPLQEKMTLFWHGHFTSSIEAIHSANLMYKQNALYRANALTTNLKEFTRAVARDPAMLLYLNNNISFKGKPNENWARELMELFTLGIGNYAENDVKEAARAFTGWNVNPALEFIYNERAHDSGAKTFLGVTGNLNGDDIIDIIFSQPAHGRWIARELFRYFVYDDPDEATINRFAEIYVKSGFNIKELVRAILLSPEFRSDRAIFAFIKSPVEYAIGALRALSARFQDVKTWQPVFWAMERMDQRLYAPPNVAGWPGNRNWINSSTYLARANFAKHVVSLEGDLTFDPVEIASSARITTDEGAMEYFLELLVQGDVPAEYRDTLRRFMRSFPASTSWDAKVRGMVRMMMSSPAYQMN